ncbi:stage III sporulation protein AH [Paenibacillus sp. V4I3]|uniref:SpoIIIAH-like family protein n=1 Tax=unclassified Paenibacillus TaxID=185978 RepID=UPI00277E07E5|nr:MULTISPECIES: SpoIIIAH-like family protein [unclassified Paenibacillus]MDQ0874971.1 stage III sporulation protein AH [Paenibacillus sp. V4I3]MDQ0889278.1 stage III sporulation protein AH [Paenibacillus sp. V4I9]
MNAKRQTIWLVSMLSLMVVLSAYYLFTEDVNKLDLATTETINKTQEVKIDMSQVDPANAAKTDVKATTGGDAKVDTKAVTPQNSTKTDAKTDVKTDAKTTTTQDASKATKPDTAKTDDQVLKIVEEQARTTSASDYFTNEQMKQRDYFSKTSSDLMEIIIDSKKTPEAVAKATNDLAKLTDIQEKVENLQDVLMKDFPQAIINQDGNKWKVTVQSDKLEKSQGVTIVDMVMKELGTGPENIKIQYVRP